MKNLKKLLAVVLVVAMAFSFAAVASAAGVSDYSDAASITNTEAVDVLSQAGVLAGVDGVFSPTGNLTREQAAKVICYLLLGSTAADMLKTSASSFSDVAVSRWSAPYIEYCVSKGVINGMGDGKFAPAGNVTGTQFAKMLLTALGYGKNGEYTGANWEINALTDALGMYILTGSADFSAPATREQVAQYALNSLTLTYQVYSKDTESYTNSTAAVKSFADKLGLVKTFNVTSNGVTGHTWKLNGTQIAFVADEVVLATSTNGTSLANLTNVYGAFYKATLDVGAMYYINGFDYTSQVIAGDDLSGGGGPDNSGINYTAFAVYAAGGNTTYATEAAFVAQQQTLQAAAAVTAIAKTGVVVKFISTDLDNKAEKVAVTEKTVDFVTNNVTKSAGIVTIPGVFTGSELAVSYPADLAKNDVVLVYADALGVTHVEKATTATGTMTAKLSTGAAIIGGVTRAESALTGKTALAGFTTYNTDATVWLDDNGNIVHFLVTDTTATANYAVLLSEASAGYTISAKLLMMDGTVKVVTLGLVDGSAATTGDTTDVFYTYTVDANGVYNLVTAPVSVASNIPGAAAFAKQATFVTGFVGDSTTVFLIDNDNTATHGTAWSAITGVANAPVPTTVTGGKAIVINGVTKYVYINTYTGTPVTPTQQVVYFVDSTTHTDYPMVGATPAYSEYAAIIDGVVTTVKVVAGTPATGLKVVTYDSTGFATVTATAVTGATVNAAGTAPGSNGTIILGGTGYTYNDSTKVFFINAFGVVTPGTVADIGTDANDVATTYLTPSGADAADLLGTVYIVVN